MDGINKIVDRIAAETRQEIEAMKAETDEKCKEILSNYDKIADEEYNKILVAGEKDCELQVQRLNSAAAMEAKKIMLAMKQQEVDNILEEATKKICALPEEEYITFLAKLAGEAAFTGVEEVIFNNNDKSSVSKAVVKSANDILKKRGIMPKLTVSDETRDILGGVIVKQGDIEINCSVETLVSLSREDLASQIAEILFAE